MQAIQTRYHGAGNVRGSRIIATAAAGRVIAEYDDTLDSPDNHTQAARALAERFDWLTDGTRIESGVLRDGSYVHVLVRP